MSARAEPGDSNGWNKHICDRLEIRRGKEQQQKAPDRLTLSRALIFVLNLTQMLSCKRNHYRLVDNSSKLRVAGFTLREVFPPKHETAARRWYLRGAGIRQLEGMGPKRFILSVDDDTEFRSRCE